MGQPLFTKKELKTYETLLTAIDEKHGYRENPRRTHFNFNNYWSDKEGCKKAHEIEMIKRAQARPDDFVNALLVLVGYRGSSYISFENAFEDNDDPTLVSDIKTHDTPENRRYLYTMLRALGEIPKSWASSAFTRFLRGTGKQKSAKYHGAGMFSVDYGWKAREIDAFSNILAGNHYATGYSTTLMTYADVDQEIHAQYDETGENDYEAHFKASRAERDVEFLTTLCDLLEKRGLSPVPRPTAKKAKKIRKPKIFKSGDRIRSATIRDLPLPAHVRLDIEQYDEESEQWIDAHIEHAVLRMETAGYYEGAPVGNGKCYTKGYNMERKDQLNGAMYLGPWTGERVNKRLDYKFRWRPRQK